MSWQHCLSLPPPLKNDVRGKLIFSKGIFFDCGTSSWEYNFPFYFFSPLEGFYFACTLACGVFVYFFRLSLHRENIPSIIEKSRVFYRFNIYPPGCDCNIREEEEKLSELFFWPQNLKVFDFRFTV